MLDSALKEQLKSIFSSLSSKYTLFVELHPSHPKGVEMVELLGEVYRVDSNHILLKPRCNISIFWVCVGGRFVLLCTGAIILAGVAGVMIYVSIDVLLPAYNHNRPPTLVNKKNNIGHKY